jgi:sigma-B regulation protein RsbU (phosphoserine phosphatase)
MAKVIPNTKTNKKAVQVSAQINEDLFSAKDFMLLQRVVRRINSILDLDELLNQIIKDASKTLGFEKCGVLLYDEKANEFELVAVTGWEDKVHQVGTRFKKDVGVVWRAFHKQKPIYYPDIYEFPEEIHCDFTSRSHIDIPLVSKGKIIGIFNAQHNNVDGFSKQKIKVLKALAAHVSVAIQNAMLYKSEKEEKEIIIRDLQEAKQMQKRLFPAESPKINNFNIAGICEPCLEVGGDWYDYIELPSGKIGVVLGDVAGKGLGAAFLMSSARMIMRMIATQEESPAKVLQKVNSILAADMPAAKFITLVYVVVDPKSRSMTIANAGHLNPTLSKKNELKFLVTERGLPLGIKDYPYKENKILLNKDDKLYLYSDGVSEAMNAKREMFEDKRIIESLGKPNANYKTLYLDVKNFIGENPPNDDLTIVMIESL